MNKLPSVKTLFVDSINLFLSSWKLFVALILIPTAAIIVTVILVGVIIATILSVSSGQVTPGRLPLLIPPLLVAVVAIIIINALSKISLIRAIASGGKGQAIQLFKSSWPMTGGFIVVQLLTALATLFGTILLIIPGLIFAVWFNFSSTIYVVEGLRGTTALKQSKMYIKGRFWPVALRILALVLVVFLISLLSSLIDNQYVNILIQLFTTFVIAPISSIYLFKLYQGTKSAAVSA